MPKETLHPPLWPPKPEKGGVSLSRSHLLHDAFVTQTVLTRTFKLYNSSSILDPTKNLLGQVLVLRQQLADSTEEETNNTEAARETRRLGWGV